MTSRALILFACAAAGVAAGGCARRETAVKAGDREQILHLGNLSEPKDLDPHTVTGVTENNISAALLEGLVAEDPQDLHPVPGVAERWTVDDGGGRYTFHLRPDARWSNGDPVTAGDFVFAYRRMLSPGTGSPYAYMLFCLTNAQAFNQGRISDFALVGAHAADERTLVLTLEAPVSYFLSLLNHYSWFPLHPPTILKHGRIDQIGTPWTRSGNFVGNGPFVLKAWDPNDRIVVARSDTYWDRDRVRLREIHFHAIGDHQTEERTFRAGQLHVTGTVPIDMIPVYRKQHPELLQLAPYLGTYYYQLNVRRPPLDDARVRRALAAAINRDQIVRYVTRAGEAPALHFTPPDAAGYTTEARLAASPAKARQWLAEAGFPGGKGFPRLTLLFNTSDAHERIAQAIQQMWKKELGVDIELVNMEWKVYLAQTQCGQYDLARAAWIGDYVDPNSFLDMWVTDGGNNRTGWSNADYDRLIRAAARAGDPAERYRLFQQAEALLMDQLPIIPIYFYRSKALVRPSVRGRFPNILDHHPYKHIYLDAGAPAAAPANAAAGRRSND